MSLSAAPQLDLTTAAISRGRLSGQEIAALSSKLLDSFVRRGDAGIIPASLRVIERLLGLGECDLYVGDGFSCDGTAPLPLWGGIAGGLPKRSLTFGGEHGPDDRPVLRRSCALAE